MFYGCSGLNDLDFINFDSNSLLRYDNMFADANKFMIVNNPNNDLQEILEQFDINTY